MELLLKITETATLTAQELDNFRDKAIQEGVTAERKLTDMILAAIGKRPAKKGARKA